MSSRRARPPTRRAVTELTQEEARRLGPTTAALVEEVKRRNLLARTTTKKPILGKDIRTPSHPGKPHGIAFPIRYRCPCCGYIVNSKVRFTWNHKFQKFRVQFGGRAPGGKGIITYTDISDLKEYQTLMLPQIERIAKRFGFQLAPLAGAPQGRVK